MSLSESDREPDPDPGPGESPVPTEEEVAAELERIDALEAAEDAERRYPSTIGGAFYLVVLAATAVGIAMSASGSWRAGIQVIAGALILAAVLRLVLPRRDAGMLAVRHRFFDCLLLAGVGGALIFLAQTIPDQPGF